MLVQLLAFTLVPAKMSRGQTGIGLISIPASIVVYAYRYVL
jgi:hypothetical protein